MNFVLKGDVNLFDFFDKKGNTQKIPRVIGIVNGVLTSVGDASNSMRLALAIGLLS